MVAMEFGCKILMLFSMLVLGKAEVYIVRVEGEPVISYKGGVDGFEATVVESDEKMDVNRYSGFFFFGVYFVFQMSGKSIKFIKFI